ncbi:MAG: hypothetical protein ABI747_02395 [Candidatus Moraniibacteriota bacterium]
MGEAILAGAVLTIGMFSVIGLITFSYRTTGDTQDLIIASELAQEGVELVRNVRDNNLVYREKNKAGACASSTAGLCDPFNGFDSGGNIRCSIDYDGPFDCANPNPALQLTGGFYQHTGTTGRYYRVIKTISSGLGIDTRYRVQSFVTWQDPGNNLNPAWCTTFNKCVYTELFLTAWK